MELTAPLPLRGIKATQQTKSGPDPGYAFLHLLVAYQANGLNPKLDNYFHYLANLLPTQLNYCPKEVETDTGLNTLASQAGQTCDLVIFDEPRQSLLKSLFFAPLGNKAVKCMPTSVLIPRHPHWPMRRILLVTRGQESDDCALDWTIRLARPSGAAVTVLAIQPALTSPQSDILQMGGILDWLATDTPLGWQLRNLEFELDNWLLEGKLRFRRGSLDNQIRTEVREGDYNLVIIAADPPEWWQRRIPGKLVEPLLQWADRPVLIAKP